MNVRAFKTRRLYHLRWWAKYSLAGFFCFVVSLSLWPHWSGIPVLLIGYGFVWLARIERKRAHQVDP